MNKMSEKSIIDIFDKNAYEDALFEYELVGFVDFSVDVKSSDSVVIKSVIKEGYVKYSTLINYNFTTNNAVKFCSCHEEDCKHLLYTFIKYNEYVEEQSKSLVQKESDDYKLGLLKNIYLLNTNSEIISLNLVLSKFKEDKLMIGLKGGIVGDNRYVIKDLDKFLCDIENKKVVQFGKNTIVDKYKLDDNSNKLFNSLLNIKNKLTKSGGSYYINIDDINIILSNLINHEITYDNNAYIVKDKLNDVALDVRQNSDGYICEFKNTTGYNKLNNRLAVNHTSKYVYYLDENQMNKIDLVNSFLGEKKQITIDKKNSNEFLNEMLPMLYNEFKVVLDFETNLKIIEEKLEVQLYCYLENKIIHIKPKFKYGEYDAFKNNDSVLIRRNSKMEDQVYRLLSDSGFVYDYNYKEFIIQAERKQYIFLTNTLYDLRQEVEVYLDPKLKNALKNLKERDFNISISNSTNSDFFEVDINIDNMDLSDVKNIIRSFKDKKEYHRLDNGDFISLVDEKLLKQLLFVEELIREEKTNLNTFRVPKYKAIYIKNNSNNVFNNINYSKEFEEYIDYIKTIKNVDFNDINLNEVKLRDYQKTGVEFINNLYKAKLGALLSDEMGLGKTIQTITFLKYNNISNALIVLPKALLYNWKNEFEKIAPNLDIELIYEKKDKRDKQIIESVNNKIILTSYNTLINDIDMYEDYIFDCVIIDEAQYIKNPGSKTAQNIKKVKGNFFLALTGTPIENNLLELWSIFDFILPSYLSDAKTFKENYITNKNEKLKNIISPFLLRRLKKDVIKELPDKIESYVYSNMEETQQKLYVEYAKEISGEVKSYVNSKNIGKKSMQVLNAITRLRQLALDPKLIVDEYDSESGKVKVFKELISEIIESEQKVLVFSQFTKMLNILEKVLEELNIKYYYLDGNTKPRKRLEDVEKFNKNNVPVYLISLKAGGLGLNLTSASNVILYDPWWNPATENQAIDRAHRIGQTKIVNVYKIVSKYSIEEKIINIKNDKIRILDETIDDTETLLSDLSTDDLTKLLYVEGE